MNYVCPAKLLSEVFSEA